MKQVRMMAVLAALFILLPAFVSCDKDDKNDPAVVDAITGTYTGSLDYSVIGYEPGNIEGEYDLKIMKDPTDADDVTVVIPQCTFTPPIGPTAFTIPSLTINDVDVTEMGGKYTFSEDDFSVKVEDVVYTGKLTGTIEGKAVKAEYVVRPGRMPMDINFTFTGTLK
ncbi:MAG: calycin-like domain-containing protein [Muribaculaceae bacterium]|nr:calycin-like domain-containing protein [Muribaculaceae bacterium]